MSDPFLEKIRNQEITLAMIPKGKKTFNICLAAVNRDAMQIRHVPKHLLNETICVAAVYKDIMAIQYVPEFVVRDTDILYVACSRGVEAFKWVANTLPQYIDSGLSLAAVKAHGMNIQYVPEALISKEMARISVERDGRSFHYLPKRFKTRDLVSSISIKFLPDELKTYDHCMEEVRLQGRMIKYVPLHFIDVDMINLALSKNIWALEFIPITYYELPSYLSALNEIRKLDAVPDFVADLAL